MSLLGDLLGFVNSGRAANAVSNANIAAEHGVLGATADAQAGIQNATNLANQIVPAAGEQSAATLRATLGDIATATQPYRAAGEQGATTLMDYAKSAPQFNFSPADLENDPGYQFQLAQGQKAIQNSMSAQGLGASGSALQELTKFGQGLAGTYYNDAFNRALQSFQTNQSSALSNIAALTNLGQFGTTALVNPMASFGSQTADTQTNLAKFLAAANIGSAEAAGQMGQRGAESAGNFAVGAGNARAGGILGQGNNLAQGATDLASLLMGLGG